MAEAGYVGTELGPPGYFGQGPEVGRMLAEHGLELMGSFLPLRFSRPDGFAEDLAAMESALDTLEAAAVDGPKPVVLLADAFLEPDRLQHAGDIEAHPETWLPPDRAELLVSEPRAGGRALPRARVPGLAPLPRRAPTSRPRARSRRWSRRSTPI